MRRLMGQERQAWLRDQRKIGLRVTDRAAKVGRQDQQAAMKSAGLGRLGNAIGQTSSLKQGNLGSRDHPYGVIFARGGDKSRGGGALEAYAEGALITPEEEWLAFPTSAVQKYISVGGRRRRMTVSLYNQSNLPNTLGPLVFIQKSATRAVYIINRVTVSPKTGRARRDTGRKTRTRIRQRSIVAFTAIKQTSRARRWNKIRVATGTHRKMPGWAAEEAQRLGYR